MITLHHLSSSRSQRIVWLLEELGAPYTIKYYKRDDTLRTAPASLRAIHPLGKSRVISDCDLVVAESGLIAEYLCDRFPEHRLAPAKSLGVNSAERLRWAYWIYYAEGSPMAPLLLHLLLAPIDAPALAPLKEGFIKRELTNHIAYWEEALSETGWFAGTAFSAADVMMAYPLEAAARLKLISDRPGITSFLERVRSRDAYVRALARGEDGFA